jgi:L-ascorbate metabolism protein UlaG (beta-lactamase superfamily)
VLTAARGDGEAFGRSNGPADPSSRIRLGARVHLRHRNPAVKYEVDCRMLFMGEGIHLVPRAFEHVSYCFSSSSDPTGLFRRLTASAEIQQFYQVERTPGGVSVLLRDSIFREPAAAEDLDLVAEVSDGRRTLEEPLPLSRWRALGHLMPLLSGRHSRDELLEHLRGGLSSADADWAAGFFRSMESAGFLVDDEEAPNLFGQSSNRPRVTLLGHSSLLVQSGRGTLLVDPVLRAEMGMPRRAFDVTRLDLDAILCSHSHWDHCDLQTLLWFDKKTPIVIPRIREATAFNPPIAPALARMGFHDVREVDHWVPLSVGDFEIVPVPFHGEQDEADAEIDHYTYVIRTEGLSLYGGVDSYQDSSGAMLPVLERVRDRYAPSIAFLPVSRMVYDYHSGGVNGFCRYLDSALHRQSFQYTASPTDAAQWVACLQPEWVCPYAVFAFPRWSTSHEIGEFSRSLHRIGLGDRFYPLRPLDALDGEDLRGGMRPMLRRQVLVSWHRLAELLLRLEGRVRRLWAYRLFRRAIRAALAERR